MCAKCNDGYTPYPDWGGLYCGKGMTCSGVKSIKKRVGYSMQTRVLG